MKNIFAVNTNTYHGFTVDQALEGIAAAGFKNIEIATVRSWTEHIMPEYEEAEIARIAKKAADLGLHFVGMSGHCNLMDAERLEDFKKNMALAHRLMTTLNKAARDCMVRYAVHACTDVTGFGLLGHAFEMAQGSDTHLTLFPGEIDLIPEALEFARDGILPAGMYRNRHYAEAAVDPGSTELAVQDMLYDPQTSGGLLIAAAPEDADALLRELRGAVPSAQRIGVVEAYNGGPRISLR